MKRLFFVLTISTCLATMATLASAQDENHWNQFRGPNGDGKSVAKGLPVEFSNTQNVRWKTAIHDKGWSSPVVWGDQVWLTTAREDGKELFAVCVDLVSGEIIHDIKVFDVAEPQLDWLGLNTHATPTPVVEEGRVYVHFGSYGTACLDTKSGEKLWENRELHCDHRVRPGSSPIIDGDSLFLTFDGVDVQFVASLDKNTGDVLWVKNREGARDLAATLRAEGLSDEDIEGTKKEKPGDNRKSYATPSIIEHQGEKQLISPGAEVTFSYNPKTGEENWRVMHEGWGWNVACRPVFENALVYLTTGVSKRILAVRPDGTGDVTETHTVWDARGRASENPSPLVVDGLFFMVSDSGGFVTCVDATSGERVWRERLPAGGSYWASPLYADGKIYFSSMEGVVSVIAATREFQLLAENRFGPTAEKKGVSAGKGKGAAGKKNPPKSKEDKEKLLEQMRAKGMSDEEIKEWFAGAADRDVGKDSQGGFAASPAVAGGAILLRSQTHLYCIGR